jgi:pentatricopeptide repeat protein
MEAKKIYPSSQSYNELLRACIVRQELGNAMRVFRSMHKLKIVIASPREAHNLLSLLAVQQADVELCIELVNLHRNMTESDVLEIMQYDIYLCIFIFLTCVCRNFCSKKEVDDTRLQTLRVSVDAALMNKKVGRISVFALLHPFRTNTYCRKSCYNYYNLQKI